MHGCVFVHITVCDSVQRGVHQRVSYCVYWHALVCIRVCVRVQEGVHLCVLVLVVVLIDVEP